MQIVLIEEYNAITLNPDECCQQIHSMINKIPTTATNSDSFSRLCAQSVATFVHIFHLLLFKYHLNAEHVCVCIYVHACPHVYTCYCYVFQCTHANRSRQMNEFICISYINMDEKVENEQFSLSLSFCPLSRL